MINIAIKKGFAASLALAAALACAGARAAVVNPLSEQALPGETPKSIIMRWPPSSRNAAQLMLEKHGNPQQFDRATMAWFNKGTWKRTVVHRRISSRDPAGALPDYLEQTVGFLVPADEVAEIKRFNPAVDASLTAGEMTYASSSESKNRLVLNLAAEICDDKRNVADARAFSRKVTRLAASGKSSPYLESLLFDYDNDLHMTPTGADR